jgi:transposase
MLRHKIRKEEKRTTLMPAPYSKDLRQKAIAVIERGECKSDVSRMLKISRNQFDLWMKRKEQTGNCQANSHYQ